MTLRFGVVSVARTSSSLSSPDASVDEDAELNVDVREVGVVGKTHSSSVAHGEEAAEDDTSPLRDGCFFLDFLAAERVFVDGVPILPFTGLR